MMASAMLPAWHAAATASRSHTRATGAPTAMHPRGPHPWVGGQPHLLEPASRRPHREAPLVPWTSVATASRVPGAATGTSPLRRRRRRRRRGGRCPRRCPRGALDGWRRHCVRCTLAWRPGPGFGVGRHAPARSATSRRHRPRTSPGSSRPSTLTSALWSTGSPAACLRTVPTWRWSITSPEAWSPRRRKPPWIDRLRPQPPSANHRRPRRTLGARRRHQPRRVADDVESLRRHGVEPIILTGVGHFSMLEDPDEFNPVLLATLATFFG